MKKVLVLIAAVIVLASGFAHLVAQNRYDVFQQALAKERGEGNLEEAILLYEKVVAEAEDRSLSAEAQLRIGICYERLGREKTRQARDAFQKVIDNFPGQAEVVRIARARLSNLSKAEGAVKEDDEKLRIRLVWKGPDMDNTGEISPDNRYLSCVDWETGDLAVRDMATGKRHHLTSKGTRLESKECVDVSIWAPDSKQIAYTWYNWDPSYRCELRVIGLGGGEPRVIYQGDYFKDWVIPQDWSPRGEHILTSFLREGGRALGLVSVEDGSIRYLKTIHGIDPHPLEAQFSPDGRYIAYEFPQDQTSRKNDVALLSSDGGREIPLIDHPADDRLLGWASDEKNVLFVSDRTGTWDAWIIQVSEGKPEGQPRLVRREMGLIGSLGFTRDGLFYYSTPGFRSDVYHASIDPKTGRAVGSPKKYPFPFEGHNSNPDLSPDGHALVYISYRGPGMRQTVLCVYSLESGEVRELSPEAEFTYYSYPRWAPDGRSILVMAQDVNKGWGVYKVDAQTGRTTFLVQQEDEAPLWCPVMSLDGKSVFYIRETSDDFHQIMMRDIETGDENEFYRIPPYDNNTMVISPDGDHLALLMREKQDERVLRVFEIVGGEPTDLDRFVFPDRHIIDLDWSPDGRYIYFSKPKPAPESDPESGDWELWRVPSGGGEAHNLGLSMHRFIQLSIHPDGKRLTFASYSMHEKAGAIWAMENFLPKEEISGAPGRID
jgi:Tol biopolymer transport system component